MGTSVGDELKEKYLPEVSSIKKVKQQQQLLNLAVSSRVRLPRAEFLPFRKIARPNDVSSDPARLVKIHSSVYLYYSLLECRFFSTPHPLPFGYVEFGINIQLAQNSISFEVFRYIHSPHRSMWCGGPGVFGTRIRRGCYRTLKRKSFRFK